MARATKKVRNDRRPITIDEKTQLLVEGNDQRNFFEALVVHLSIPNIQIQNFGGVDELRGFLSGFARIPNFAKVRRMGIVRDAETSARSAFESVQSALRNAHLPAPPHAGGRSEGSPRVSVFVLPDNSQPGMLETLLCRTFAGTAEDRCIDKYFACVHAPVHRPEKARVRAWLATKPDPNLSVGVAAKKKNRYWDLNDAVFADLRDFMQKL